MSRKNSTIALALLGVGILAATTACSPASSGEGTAAEPASLRLALWDEAQIPAMNALIDEFEAEHPEITVEVELTPFGQYWTKLETAATGRAAPDVFWMALGEFRRFAANDIIVDYSELMERDGYTLDGMYPELQTAYTWEDGLYGIPKDIDNIGLWYNKSLFDAAGVAYPDETWTWDSVLEAAQALTDADAGVWGISSEGGSGQDRQMMSSVFQNGGFYLTDEGESGFESAETIEAVQWWIDLIDVHGVSPTTQQLVETPGADLFKSGKVAMYYGGSWNAGIFAADPAGADFDVAVLPEGPVQTASAAHTIGWATYAESKYPEQAWELVKFLGSVRASEIQAETSTVIPAHEAASAAWVASAPQYNLKAFIDQAANAAVFTPADVNAGAIRSKAKEIYQKAFLGEMSVAEAGAELTAYVNSLRD